MSIRHDSIDIWCERCSAQFRNDCICPETLELPPPDGDDVWVGVDGHTYVGDRKRPSSAYHSEDCRCHRVKDF